MSLNVGTGPGAGKRQRRSKRREKFHKFLAIFESALRKFFAARARSKREEAAGSKTHKEPLHYYACAK